MKNNIQLPIWHRKFNTSALHLLTGATFFLLLPQAYAAEVTKNATLTAGIDYDSNPAMSSTQKSPVWIFTLIPELRLDVKDDINQWFLDGALKVQRNSNEKVLINREDPNVSAGWNHIYESGFFGLKANYVEKSSLLAQLTSAGVYNPADNTEKDKELAANWLHNINSSLSVLTDAAYRDVTFNFFTPGSLVSYNLGEIGSKLTYLNNEKLDTYVQLGYAHLNPDMNVDSTDKARLLMGADYKINESLKIGASAGIYNLSGRQSDTDWEGGIIATYAAEHMNYSFSLDRGVVVSGFGGFQKSDTLSLGWTYDRSELDRFGANYNYNKFHKDTGIGLAGVDYQEVSAFYERSISNHWKGRLSAAYRKLDSQGSNSNGTDIGATLVYDTLSF